jgi:2,3-bisphosphoglycerate-independent phosphoglycerate mutase
MDAVRDAGTLHLMGLLSDGGVHSHNTHLYALLEMAKRRGVRSVAVHAFLDGRDTPPESGAGYLADLQSKIDTLGVGRIATVTGRYYAMDRDKRWDRVERAYRALRSGEGEPFTDAVAAVRASYAAGVTDEFVVPHVREDFGGVADGDAIVFTNFRPDRAREMTRAFTDADFDGFSRKPCRLSSYVCMTCYDETITGVDVAFLPQRPTHTLGEELETGGKCQLRIAETEKYAHVTFFFNGGVEEPFAHEERILVPSPSVATYDLQPEMSAPLVTERMLEALRRDQFDAAVLNFANCDMVGHTGVFEAAVKAVEAVDSGVGAICDEVLKRGGVVFLTADHGNAETMTEPDGAPMTAHTTNRVPFVTIGVEKALRDGGALCDIAPTILEQMGLPQPAEMTGRSLFA